MALITRIIFRTTTIFQPGPGQAGGLMSGRQIPPFSPEPMPGLAAFKFVEGRQGIILFTHYGADTSTYGTRIGWAILTAT
jgi:hypothetical protein